MKYNPPVGGAANDPYIDGNPGAGIEGSPVPAKAIEAPQREIVAVLTGAGLTPDENNNGQLLQAIPILSGISNLLKARGTTIPSAATTNLGAADSDYVEISGTTGITSLGSTTTRNHMWVKFQGALTLTHNAASLILPTGANIVTAAGDTAEFIRISGSNWQCVGYYRASGQALVSAASPLGAKGTTIASAGTTDIGAADSSHVEIIGSTTITSLGGSTTRDHMWLAFQGSLTLTHHATALILPGGANIVTAAGDVAEFVRVSGSNWRCLNYERASGQGVFYPTAYGATTGGTTAYAVTTGVKPGALFAGQNLAITFNTGNTGASTLDVNGQGAVAIKDCLGNALGASQIVANRTYLLVYDGASWRILTLIGQNMPPGTLVQRRYATYTANASFNTALPIDDTVPTLTEGAEWISDTITGTTGNKLRIIVGGSLSGPNSDFGITINDNVNTLQAATHDAPTAANGRTFVTMVETTATGAAQRFASRIGNNAGSNCRLNGTSSAREFGGAQSSYMIIEEFQV